jgi:hypothetical protein
MVKFRLYRVRVPAREFPDRPLEEVGGRTSERADTLVKDTRISERFRPLAVKSSATSFIPTAQQIAGAVDRYGSQCRCCQVRSEDRPELSAFANRS